MAERELTVASRREAATDVVLLTLRDPVGRPLPQWEPGAHIDLVMPGLVRQYSLCGNQSDRFSWQVAVLSQRDGRGGSAYVHDHLYPGATVGFRGPSNNFPLVE